MRKPVLLDDNEIKLLQDLLNEESKRIYSKKRKAYRSANSTAEYYECIKKENAIDKIFAATVCATLN